MNSVIADTHSILWFLFEPKLLSAAAFQALTLASTTGRIYISAITLVEVHYLLEKRKVQYPQALVDLYSLIADPYEPLEVIPVSVSVAQAMSRVPRNEVPDMPDRIIASTAVDRILPVVSVDADIRNSASLKAIIPVIW